MGEVELADALIRTLDLGGSQGWAYHRFVSEQEFDEYRDLIKDKSVGHRHLCINVDLAGLAERLADDASQTTCERAYAKVIDAILVVASSFDYDVIAAMDEKLIYNQHRQDHKRANRAQPGGKKF